MSRRALLWLFRDRLRGGITVAQWPNLALSLFAGGWLLEATLGPTGRAGELLAFLTRACLAWWAADELLRGVNPWRRFLGAATLLWLCSGLLRAAR